MMNDNGTISEAGELYIGMDRFDVRKKIAEDLSAGRSSCKNRRTFEQSWIQ
jgi:valyl-tRNA synthetase